jgi:hypothetical protein
MFLNTLEPVFLQLTEVDYSCAYFQQNSMPPDIAKKFNLVFTEREWWMNNWWWRFYTPTTTKTLDFHAAFRSWEFKSITLLGKLQIILLATFTKYCMLLGNVFEYCTSLSVAAVVAKIQCFCWQYFKILMDPYWGSVLSIFPSRMTISISVSICQATMDVRGT